jgi:RNA polymerase sigma-70 factor (ECF subfamily)
VSRVLQHRVGGVNHVDALRWYDEHGPALLAYACALLRDPSAAEDVLHQVFLNVLRGRAAVSGAPAPYLFRAVRNTAPNHIRGQSREVELADGGLWLESPDGSKETAMALQSALKTLPTEQREVVVLKIWGQLTFEESAAVIGISSNTAASRYRYGIEKLREIWNG